MKNTHLVDYLDREGIRFAELAKEHAAKSLRKSSDGRSITELDARLIRDHQVRSETYKDAARIALGHKA